MAFRWDDRLSSRWSFADTTFVLLLQQSGAEEFPVDTSFSDAIDWVLVAFVGVLAAILAVSAFLHRRRVAAAITAKSSTPSASAEAAAARRVAALVEAERDASSRRRDLPDMAALLEANGRANRMLPSNLELLVASSRSRKTAMSEESENDAGNERRGGVGTPVRPSRG